MATPIGFNPGTYTDTSGTAFTLGEIYTYQGTPFQYWKNAADGSTAYGYCAVRAHATSWIATYSKGASAINTAVNGVGFWCGVVPANNYGFVQVGGIITGRDSANGCTAGKRLTPSTTSDGDVKNVTNAYDPSVGRARANGSGTLVTVEVYIS